MLLYVLIIFAVAALGGLVLARMHLKDDDAPLGLAAVHGLLGAAGLVLLVWFVLQNGAGGMLWGSVILFVLAALGGFVLITKHLRGESLSSGLIYTHGAAAVIGFVLLLFVYLR